MQALKLLRKAYKKIINSGRLPFLSVTLFVCYHCLPLSFKEKEKTVKEDKKKVGVHIEKGLWDKLSDIAKKEYRSTSALVRMIISKYVEGYNNDNK